MPGLLGHRTLLLRMTPAKGEFRLPDKMIESVILSKAKDLTTPDKAERLNTFRIDAAHILIFL